MFEIGKAYRLKGDAIPETILECLKDDGENLPLMDEWGYDENATNQRYDHARIYETGGNLIGVENFKFEDYEEFDIINFEIKGSMGHLLIEKKPSYDDLLKRISHLSGEVRTKTDYINEQRTIIDKRDEEIKLFKTGQGKRSSKREEDLKKKVQDLENEITKQNN